MISIAVNGFSDLVLRMSSAAMNFLIFQFRYLKLISTLILVERCPAIPNRCRENKVLNTSACYGSHSPECTCFWSVSRPTKIKKRPRALLFTVPNCAKHPGAYPSTCTRDFTETDDQHYSLSYQGNCCPLALQARGWVHGIRTAFSNIDRKGIERMERYGYMGA